MLSREDRHLTTDNVRLFIHLRDRPKQWKAVQIELLFKKGFHSMNPEEKKVPDFNAILDSLQIVEEDEEIGSYELAVEAGKLAGVKNPEKFALTAGHVYNLDDTLDFSELLAAAWEITQIWEAE